MTNVSNLLLERLAAVGVKTFFGVQGGACAHLIEAACLNGDTQFIPVLNEQAAGLSAHGHYFSSGKSAGAMVTTGPGFFNLMTGIAACYYDDVPAVFLCGQVNAGLNMAQEFGVKMYGFQETPHAEIAAHIADTCLKVRNDEELRTALAAIETLGHGTITGPLVLEIQDDYQRNDFSEDAVEASVPVPADETLTGLDHDLKDVISALQRSRKPLLVIGGGVMRSSEPIEVALDAVSASLDIPVTFSWGGQRFYRTDNANHVGLFGTHSPGVGNSLVQSCDLLIGVGVSLLQHQAGKVKDQFAPQADILVVNREPQETTRYHHDYGNRISVITADSAQFLCQLADYLKTHKPNTTYWPEISRTENRRDWASGVDRDLYAKLKTHEPVKALAEILQACPKDYWAFSDAGATLSWTYQAASICDSPPITTAFNLHAMGYALPAAVGAAVACDRPGILSISGDGGFLMNVQELAVAIGCQVPIKVVVIDNEGYGIIRQTQDTFLGGRYFGSDKGAFPSLPNYRIAEIIKGFGFEVLESGSENAADTARWLFEKQSGHRAVIIKVDPKTEVEGVAPKYAPLAF